ncbi:hypothetical protein GF420_09915 [candidate division GN15 bacterium]|nr:hypothetical protein [candidate division GN15 bacterium]
MKRPPQKTTRRIVLLALLAIAAFALAVPAQTTDPSEPVADTLLPDTSAITPSQAPAPVPSVTVKDNPNDNGGAIRITWELSPADTAGGLVAGYNVYRADSETGEFRPVADAPSGTAFATDNRVENGKDYYYKVTAYSQYIDAGEDKVQVQSSGQVYGPVQASWQVFNMDRLICLILVLTVSGSIIHFIRKARRGGAIYVRKIGGIDAVEEAVGRATEMGKKIFYIPGIQDMNDVQTIAGIAILGRVAEKAAEYETWLEVPVSKSLVMVTARETMKEAYAKMGRPDNFQENQVHYLTDDQFGYAAAIDGMVVREKPATIFYMGAFFAESLILAETGNAAGAIQIAGTAMPSQLPFFIAACDFTLIGEELFAASAYLSGEPRQLGSLKGQDVGKAIFLILIIVGIIFATLNIYDLSPYIKVGQ